MSGDELFGAIVRKDEATALRTIAADPALVNVRDPHLGSSALHFAAHRGLRTLVDALLRAGADACALEAASGTTPLHWAAEGGHTAVCARLLDAGARLDIVDSWFELAPLGWATVVDWAPQLRDDRPSTVRHLLERGARLDVFSAVALGRDADLAVMTVDDPRAISLRLGFVAQGRTPLHVAAERGYVDATRVLLDAGAAVNARTSFGETPLSLADTSAETMSGPRGVASVAPMRSLIIERGGVDELHHLERHVHGGVLDIDTRTALLFACAWRGLSDSARLLLDSGARRTATRRVLEGELPIEATPARLAKIRGYDALSALLS